MSITRKQERHVESKPAISIVVMGQRSLGPRSGSSPGFHSWITVSFQLSATPPLHRIVSDRLDFGHMVSRGNKRRSLMKCASPVCTCIAFSDRGEFECTNGKIADIFFACI